ncbi:MAG: MarR family transcriptional regulator [Oscillospiraceae bacterium]|nr:MarR family transcriptional regulator [Oscillospiraceae bacterium]
MNIPQITSIDNALKIFYSHPELGNKEITILFGRLSSATTAKLKKLAREEMIKREKLSYGMYKVNTSVAYDVWGIDVMDLEARRNKLKALELQ